MSTNPRYLDYLDSDSADPSRQVAWRLLGWVSVALSVVLVATSLTAYAAYRKLQGNIHHEDVDLDPSRRPPKLNRALNVLLIGSDTRAGANAKYGRGYVNEGARSDTILLLHLSPDGDRAVGVSFPRDSVVQIPECKDTAGKVMAAHTGMINESFNEGGASCTWRTIESLTKIRIDHFVQVDFSGFKRVVDALGGVEVCLPKAVNDPKSHLRLPAGTHVVSGENALAYVRTRYNLGDGSDLSRIKRQQKFMGAVVSKATSGDLLKEPSKLYGFLDAVTKSITTDKDLTVDVMKQIAGSLRGMSAGKVRFVTVPWHPYPGNPNRIEWTAAEADQLFTAIRADNDVTPAKQAKAPAAPLTPDKVSVRVLNGTSISGLARRAADQLQARGFKVVEVGTAPARTSQTQVLYGSGADQEAATLAAAIPGTRPQAGQSSAAGLVELVLGQNWTGLGAAAKPPASIPKTSDEIRADDNICKAT